MKKKNNSIYEETINTNAISLYKDLLFQIELTFEEQQIIDNLFKENTKNE